MNIRELWHGWIGWPGACAAIAAVAVAGMVHLQLSYILDARTERVRFLDNEVAKLNKDVAEVLELREMIQATLARKAIVEAIRKGRERGASLLGHAARLRPAGIRIDELRFERGDAYAHVAGAAQSRKAIALLVEKWKASPHFGEPVQVQTAPAAPVDGAYSLKFSYRAVVR